MRFIEYDDTWLFLELGINLGLAHVGQLHLRYGHRHVLFLCHEVCQQGLAGKRYGDILCVQSTEKASNAEGLKNSDCHTSTVAVSPQPCAVESNTIAIGRCGRR